MGGKEKNSEFKKIFLNEKMKRSDICKKSFQIVNKKIKNTSVNLTITGETRLRNFSVDWIILSRYSGDRGGQHIQSRVRTSIISSISSQGILTSIHGNIIGRRSITTVSGSRSSIRSSISSWSSILASSTGGLSRKTAAFPEIKMLKIQFSSFFVVDYFTFQAQLYCLHVQLGPHHGVHHRERQLQALKIY